MAALLVPGHREGNLSQSETRMVDRETQNADLAGTGREGQESRRMVSRCGPAERCPGVETFPHPDPDPTGAMLLTS